MRIAIDTGGTFTDCVWIENGRVRMLKVFSTPDDPSQAIVEALERTGVKARTESVVLLHGTTVGTNCLLQRGGARVAFVTTQGFEDSIQIGRQARPKLYDFFFDAIEPLVSSELRFGVPERTDCEGKILRRPTGAELRRLRQDILRQRPQAIAVSLLFSFANPANEKAVAAALSNISRTGRFGVNANKVPVSLSHKILPEFREYERASTVVVNAYLQPLMQGYFQKLADRVAAWSSTNMRRLSGRGNSFFVMQSGGGITSLAAAESEPVRTVLSGPAGGVAGAAVVARRSGFDRIITFDMGGTSTDVALVEDEPRATSEAEVAGLPVRVPMLDIHTVGAGGGSIARFDVGGALRVGPLSAGADPGPICYGKGELPTVTDANLLLGRMSPDNFLSGELKLDFGRTHKIVGRWLKAQRSRFSVEQFAAGVVQVVNANMEKAIRLVSIERGYDPRDFALVAFGGAGGLHACELALSMGIPRVLIPQLPGALSAYGILVSDIVKDYSRTVLWRVSGDLPYGKLQAEFRGFEKMAHSDFRRERWKGTHSFLRTIDVRYRGQGYELNVPFTRDLLADFHREHQKRYGYSRSKSEVEIVTLRLRARLKNDEKAKTGSRVADQVMPTGKAAARSPVIFAGRKLLATIHDRSALVGGKSYSGPAIVNEYGATTVIPPDVRFHVDRAGNLVILTKVLPSNRKK